MLNKTLVVKWPGSSDARTQRYVKYTLREVNVIPYMVKDSQGKLLFFIKKIKLWTFLKHLATSDYHNSDVGMNFFYTFPNLFKSTHMNIYKHQLFEEVCGCLEAVRFSVSFTSFQMVLTKKSYPMFLRGILSRPIMEFPASSWYFWHSLVKKTSIKHDTTNTHTHTQTFGKLLFFYINLIR